MADLFRPTGGIVTPELRASHDALVSFLETYRVPVYIRAKHGDIYNDIDNLAHLIVGYYIRDDPAGALPVEWWSADLVEHFLAMVFLGTENMSAWDFTLGKPSLPA
ncbi:hypothetical protein TI39_contig498g00004 [Zymoseptoria brevis]|uniref:Uncharacterized protein n=1 Tax=Zymoseptoria brevis TaxID=1047168 RepID=A0A0F4GJZ9_9PEZI|nr:hypothetical protein TI39_contig498g00004 [Zymoseptoria brevis]